MLSTSQSTHARQPRVHSPHTLVNHRFQALPSQLRLSKPHDPPCWLNFNLSCPVRLVQTGESAHDTRGIPTGLLLAVLKALYPCGLWAILELECFDPGRPVIVQQRFHHT